MKSGRRLSSFQRSEAVLGEDFVGGRAGFVVVCGGCEAELLVSSERRLDMLDARVESADAIVGELGEVGDDYTGWL